MSDRQRRAYDKNQYEANTAEVMRSFEAFGDIKGHFDLVRNRGMLFVTYVRTMQGKLDKMMELTCPFLSVRLSCC